MSSAFKKNTGRKQYDCHNVGDNKVWIELFSET
jgi:hypothetical protein